jgi:hypothetical protein
LFHNRKLSESDQELKKEILCFRSKADGTDYEITYGLWQSCESYLGVKTCDNVQCPSDNYDNDSGFCSKILASRAFVTLACIMSGIAAICLFSFAVTRENTNGILLLATKGLVFACVIAGIIGVAIGANATLSLSDDIGASLNLGAAAAIGIVAIIINFFGGIAAIFIKK